MLIFLIAIEYHVVDALNNQQCVQDGENIWAIGHQ